MDGPLRFTLTCLSVLVLSSCSQKHASGRKRSFLKDRATLLEKRLEWSESVSGDGPAIAERQSVSPELQQYPIVHIAATRFESLQKSYPYLEGFASLDTSGYSDASMAALEGFCQALEAGKGEDPFMDKDFLFSLALFKYALPAYGNGGNPVTIQSHIIGMPRPAQGQGGLQCPVRLVLADGGVCDVFIYIIKAGADWKVQQIDFMKKKGAEEHGRR